MNAYNSISCQPPRPPLWHYPYMAVLICFPAALITAFVLMPIELKNNFETPGNIKLAIVAGSYAAAAVIMIAFLRRQQEAWHWQLTDDALVRGRHRPARIPLDSLVKIVPGLPDRKLVKFVFGNTAGRPLREAIEHDLTISLLLIFDDGAIMPFHVHRCDGGTRLMTELVRRRPNLVDDTYEYSQAEISALETADWNRLTRPRSAGTRPPASGGSA